MLPIVTGRFYLLFISLLQQRETTNNHVFHWRDLRKLYYIKPFNVAKPNALQLEAS